MPAPVLTLATPILCPHGGSAIAAPREGRVRVMGVPVATIADRFPVSGCAFADASGPHPCQDIAWQAASTRTRIAGAAILLQTSQATALRNGMPAGPAIVTPGQTRVRML